MSKKVKLVETCLATNDFLSEKETLNYLVPDTDAVELNVVNIYDDIKYQTIDGFGGAFTESAQVTYDSMPEELREEFMTAYFDKEKGIGYNLCRTHVNSCDFSLESYNFDDTDGDFELKDFNIDRMRKGMIPFIKEAQGLAPDMKLFVSPWSPPGWMKENGRMTWGSPLKKECYQVWADYTARFIKEYEQEGIKIWGLTIQNEPNANQLFDSCQYSPEQERDFLKVLGPTYKKAGLGDKKIIFWDHNKERLVDRAKVMLSDPEAAKYVYGMGIHWYSGEHYTAMDIAHELYPNVPIYATEACVGFGTDSNFFPLSGEHYAHDIIGDLNHWVCGWTDWNMLLNEVGGPIHYDYDGRRPFSMTCCEAPLIYNRNTKKLEYRSTYYYMGHFSKYIKRGARRIGSSSFNYNLEVAAFENPDGQKVIVLLNRKDKDFFFTLRTGDGIINVHIKPRSIQTLLF